MRAFAKAFILFGLPLGLPCAPAHAASVEMPVTIAGLPIARLDYTVELDDLAYTVTGTGRTGGLGRLASSATSSFTSKGRLTPDGPRPVSHRLRYTEEKKKGSATIAFEGGRAASVSETPPPKPRRDRVKVTPAMLRGAVDPISAMIVPGSPKTGLATLCNRTIKVLDARNVFELKLSPLRSGRLADGKRTHTCRVRYVPLAGHRDSSKAVKRFAKNRSLRMTFASLGPTVWGVVGFRFKSRFGVISGRAKGVAS